MSLPDRLLAQENTLEQTMQEIARTTDVTVHFQDDSVATFTFPGDVQVEIFCYEEADGTFGLDKLLTIFDPANRNNAVYLPFDSIKFIATGV